MKKKITTIIIISVVLVAALLISMMVIGNNKKVAVASATPTITPSPTISSVYPSVGDIRNALKIDFEDIKKTIQETKQKSDNENYWAGVWGGVLSNFLWQVIVWIITGLLSISFAVQLVTKIKIWRNKRTGKEPSIKLEIIDRVLSNLNIIYILLFVITLVLFSSISASAINQAAEKQNLSAVTNKLDKIDQNIQTLSEKIPTSAPTPTIQPPCNCTNYGNSDSTSPKILDLIQWPIATFIFFAIVLFVLGMWVVRHQARILEFEPVQRNWQELAKDMLPSIFLALIITVLPYPVNSILLPLIVHLFIFAFFDLVRMYPNIYLKRLTVKHFTKIIFLSEFGVWFGFFEVFMRYFGSIGDLGRELTRPSIEAITNLLIKNFQGPTGLYISSYYIQELIFDFLMLLFAYAFASIASRRVRKYAEENIIPNILATIGSQKPK